MSGARFPIACAKFAALIKTPAAPQHRATLPRDEKKSGVLYYFCTPPSHCLLFNLNCASSLFNS
jgi:hypothetical protein